MQAIPCCLGQSLPGRAGEHADGPLSVQTMESEVEGGGASTRKEGVSCVGDEPFLESWLGLCLSKS